MYLCCVVWVQHSLKLSGVLSLLYFIWNNWQGKGWGRIRLFVIYIEMVVNMFNGENFKYSGYCCSCTWSLQALWLLQHVKFASIFIAVAARELWKYSDYCYTCTWTCEHCGYCFTCTWHIQQPGDETQTFHGIYTV